MPQESSRATGTRPCHRIRPCHRNPAVVHSAVARYSPTWNQEYPSSLDTNKHPSRIIVLYITKFTNPNFILLHRSPVQEYSLKDACLVRYTDRPIVPRGNHHSGVSPGRGLQEAPGGDRLSCGRGPMETPCLRATMSNGRHLGSARHIPHKSRFRAQLPSLILYAVMTAVCTQPAAATCVVDGTNMQGLTPRPKPGDNAFHGPISTYSFPIRPTG